jgi:LIVCS family branched-chain amino acid:cation transporter
MAGYFLLIYGTIVNLIAFFGLMLFGIFSPEHSKESVKSALILLINIPIAYLYFCLGISIL